MKNYDKNNTFARLLRDEIPSVRVYEDKDSIAFMDVMPQAMGHTLVIPRKASRNLMDAEPETLARLIITIQKVAKAVQKACFSDGITILQFNEAAAGQTIHHLHFHIIPRFKGDVINSHTEKIIERAKLEKIAKKIRSNLQGPTGPLR